MIVSADEYSISVKNCNSISNAQITIRRGALNIKHGPNGIGKSTIARSLWLNAQGEDALLELLPFKHRGNGEESVLPAVDGADAIRSVLVFDEAYVSQFVFQQDEVLKNSFEIFVRTDQYQRGLDELESIFEGLRLLFTENKALDEVISSLSELRSAFALTKSGEIAKTSKGYKALGVGGKLAQIPKPLEGFTDFLRSDDPATWLTWQAKGKSYLDMSDNCPFCSARHLNKETASAVSKEYESAAVRNMGALRLVIDRLASFFVAGKLEQLRQITSSLDGPSPEQVQFLATLRGQIDTLLGKFLSLKALSFATLRDEPNVETALTNLKIDLKLLDALDSEPARAVVDGMNEELDLVASQISEIKRRVGIQKSEVARSIKRNQDDINVFLTSAGYKYSVRIESSGDSYRMIVEHEDARGHLEEAGSHLSYGERNAFALVLFMYQVLREAPDLVVLDDPVSSFDKTKKFAILHKLFHGKNSLRGVTSLLLTHDIEPAIDVVRATSGQFEGARPSVHFLHSSDGIVREKEIRRADIMTFSQVCDENVSSSADPVIKCIYLRRRYEVHGNLDVEYDILSSLLHLREVPVSKVDGGGLAPMGSHELAIGIASIKEDIPDFDYEGLLRELKDPEIVRKMFDDTVVGYEKVQIFRIASQMGSNASEGDAAFKKFINESYHIENEYVMQLNPRDFDAVPEHIVRECSALLNR